MSPTDGRTDTVMKREVKLFARRQANELKVKVENLERQPKEKDVDHKKVKDLQEFTNNLLLVKEREFRLGVNQMNLLLQMKYSTKKFRVFKLPQKMT